MFGSAFNNVAEEIFIFQDRRARRTCLHQELANEHNKGSKRFSFVGDSLEKGGSP